MIYSDGSVTLGHFHENTNALHGFSYTYSSHSQEILSAGYFDQGVPTGPFLRLEPHFQTGLFGTTNTKETGEFSLLEIGGDRSGRGVHGLFKDGGVLQGAGKDAKVDKVWFEEKGLMMRVSVVVVDENATSAKEFAPGK